MKIPSSGSRVPLEGQMYWETWRSRIYSYDQ